MAETDEEWVLRDAVRLVKAGHLKGSEEEQALELDERVFDDAMRHLPQASGPGSSQWRWEHLTGGPEWVCVKAADAKNTFNAVPCEAMFEAIERDFPELWAWTDLCYGIEANRGFRLGGADESVMRKDNHPSVVICAYLGDAFFMGPPAVAALAYGKAEVVTAKMLKKVEDLCAILPALNKAWDAIGETDFATQNGTCYGTQSSEGTQHEQSGQASGEADEAGGAQAGPSGLNRAASSIEDIRMEWDDRPSSGVEGWV
ncbi:hypothetical protein CYMTET_16304 [Cymbomonas tetramitiformis]|uniref:Uncharacterized protein n=1 Tax=Cymbomonas tetramitiformis TaxID=36881 RepID=A0AAE0GCA1_9CHLO|nr:hypothetical protein CYMTET_16304 [Cymbomonas tetramitiformis]